MFLSKVLFVNDTREFLYINTYRRLVTGLPVSNGVAFVEQINVDDSLFKQLRISEFREPLLGYAVRVDSHGKRVNYYMSDFDESCGSSTWILQRRDVAGERSWLFARMIDTLRIPSDYGFQYLWKAHITGLSFHPMMLGLLYQPCCR